MSQVYSTEPQTSGQVIFETTHGPLSIHLWCKECPYTTRYFLQLCIDGYYNNLIFHRIIPNFLIQTGDAQYRQQSTSSASSSSLSDNGNPYTQPPSQQYREQYNSNQAYERRKYELNSRIRFNHRGQIAMALGISDDTDGTDSIPLLQPQFFVTLEEANHLDGKHVIFGGVSGPTVFNAIRIGQTDIYDTVDGSLAYQPRIVQEAPRILRTKVLSVDLPPTIPSLIPSMEPPILPWNGVDPTTNGTTTTKHNNTAVDGTTTMGKKKKIRKGVKNVNLLSFGGDEELLVDNEGGVNSDDDGDGHQKIKKRKSTKIQSSHDVLSSLQERNDEDNRKKGSSHLVNHIDKELERRLLQTEKEDVRVGENDNLHPIMSQGKSQPQPSMIQGIHDDNEEHDGPYTSTTAFDKEIKSTNEPVAAAAGDNARNVTGNTDNNDNRNIAVPPKKMSLVEARRAKYTNNKKSMVVTIQPKTKDDKQQREIDTMAKFKAFQQKIMSKQPSSASASSSSFSLVLSSSTGGKVDYDNKKRSRDLPDDMAGNDDIDDNNNNNKKRTDHKKKKKNRNREDKDGDPEREYATTTIGYHGQVLEIDTDEEGDNGAWIQTRFKCKKHMDVNAKNVGGDGRSTDDYVVVEERSSATDRKPDRKRNNSNLRR